MAQYHPGPTATEIFTLVLVPGGRYLVTVFGNALGVWDLGYVSDGVDMSKPTQLWCTGVPVDTEEFRVQPSPDGLGLRILVYCPSYVIT